MKRFLMSTLAAGMALSLIGAPLALAEPDQHGPQAQHAQGHAPPAHADISRGGQHSAMAHAPQPPQAMQHGHVSHPPMQMSHAENHSPPPPHQAFGGGHQWHSGDHYDGSRHYVSNWNSYHLAAPPPGYQWVQDGSQFVLIAVATGIITSVILNSAYQ